MSKTVVEFTKEELKQLLEDEKSCVHLKRNELSLALFPCHLADFNSSIKEILNSKKAKYLRELDGILLGYKNIKLLSNDGTIMNDSCYVHIDIEADFYIFKPEIGSTLKGIVNKVSKCHIGCLVHRLFNISVHKADDDENWLGNFVDIGHEVVLNVIHIDLHSRLPFIQATLDEKQFENTEAYKARNNIETEIVDDSLTETPVNKKKKHRSNISNLIDSIEENNEMITEKKKKHKNKHKNDDSGNDSMIVDEDEDIKKNKKKRKSKDNKETNLINNEIKSPKKKSKKSIELNLSKNQSFDSVNLTMADFEDRKNKKSTNAKISNISLENIELNLHDSDLEKTLNETPKKKKKHENLHEHKSKKRKRENSDDETIKKHKKKRHSLETENS